jgi:uncharacterized protein YtpQ (UPF0354 family)
MFWKQKPEGKQIGREDLFATYLKAASEKFAPRKVTFEPPDVLKIQVEGRGVLAVRLENLWRQCSSGGPVDAIVKGHLDSIAGLLEPKPAQIPKENIVPLIRDEAYLRSMKGGEGIAREHLAGDLWIIYALDQPGAVLPLGDAQLEKLAVNSSDLRQLAVANLKKMLPGIENHSAGPLQVLTAGNCYEASLLLLDDLWNELQKIVSGDVVVAVPSRTVVLFTGSGSAEGILAVRQRAREVHSTGQGPVSQTLLRRVSGVWQVF